MLILSETSKINACIVSFIDTIKMRFNEEKGQL